jgi:phosphatidylserine/phosphatidylglycerophosphate/cardiolipin synthase-like enzyme
MSDTNTIFFKQEKRFFAQEEIEAYCGPRELGAPDDLEAVIINFINEAQDSLKIAVQELDNVAIAQAIIDARWRGVKVQIYVEQDYLLASSDTLKQTMAAVPENDEEIRQDRQWMEHDDNELGINRKIFTTLLRNQIDVKADYNPKIFHQKFIVRDYNTRKKGLKPALLTGSANFTFTGTHKNLNHLVIFHNRYIAGKYDDEFQQMREGKFGQAGDTKTSEISTYNLGGVPVRILFAPDHTPELEIVKRMLKARRRVDFAIFTFSGSSAIDDAMLMLNLAGVEIRGVLERKQGNQKWSARKWLQQAGIDFYYPNARKFSGEFGKLHHKLMVIDQYTVIGGSMNYTAPANDYNDENIFVIGSPYILEKGKGGPVNMSECMRITQFFRSEINRIIEHSDLQEKK